MLCIAVNVPAISIFFAH